MRFAAVVVAVAAASAVACSAVLGLRDIDEAAPNDVHDGAAGGDGHADDAGGGGGDGAACDTASDRSCGTCGHDCLGGRCVAGVCQASEIVSGEAHPFAVGVAKGYLYWANRGDVDGMGQTTPGFRRMDLSGGAPRDLVGGMGTDFVVDPAGQWLYFTGNGKLQALPTTGGMARMLDNQSFAGFERPYLTSDATRVVSGSLDHEVVVAPVDGSASRLVGNDANPSLFLVTSGGDVYWTVYKAPGFDIARSALDAAVGTREIVFPDRAIPTPVFFAGGSLYWVEHVRAGDGSSKSTLFRGDPAAKTASPLSDVIDADVEIAASGGGRIWFLIEGSFGEIRSCPLDGCGANDAKMTVHAHDVAFPSAIATDDRAVYVAVSGDSGKVASGSILRVAK